MNSKDSFGAELVEVRTTEYKNPRTVDSKIDCVGMSQGLCSMGHVHTLLHFCSSNGQSDWWLECDLLPGPQIIGADMESAWVGFN